MTAFLCHAVDTEGTCVLLIKKVQIKCDVVMCKQTADPFFAVFPWNTSLLYFDLPILMGSNEDGIQRKYRGLPFPHW